MNDHICMICFVSFRIHKDDHWPPRCCNGCPCGVTRPAEGAEAEPPPAEPQQQERPS